MSGAFRNIKNVRSIKKSRTQKVAAEVAQAGHLLVQHNFRGGSVNIKFLSGETIEALQRRLCDEFARGSFPWAKAPKNIYIEQMTLIHDSKSLVDQYTVDDYELKAGDVIVLEYVKPMFVFGKVEIFGESEKTGVVRTVGVDHNCSFSTQKPLFFPDARASDIMCVEIMDKKRKVPLGGQSVLLEDVFFTMCRDSMSEITMRVPLCSKDGDFAGNVNLKVTRPRTGGFNIQLLACESLRDTAIMTSLKGQVDWALFHIGAVILVVFYIVGCLVYGLAPHPFSAEDEVCTSNFSCAVDSNNESYVLESIKCVPFDEATTAAQRFADALYFSTVTLTTIGYGDISPKGDSMRLFTVFFAIVAVGVVGPAVGVLLDTCSALKYRARRSVYKRENVRMRHSKQLRQCCTESTAYLFFAAAVIVGVVYFYLEGLSEGHEEGQAFTAAIYFTIITSTTIGYGDYSPQSSVGRVIACAYMLAATIVIAMFFDKLSSYLIDMREEKLRQKAIQSYGKGLDKDELKGIVKETCTMFADDGNACSKAEFVLFMALRAKIVDREDIDECIEAFEKLDQNRSGTLTLEDCVFIPERIAKLGRERVMAELQKIEEQVEAEAEQARGTNSRPQSGKHSRPHSGKKNSKKYRESKLQRESKSPTPVRGPESKRRAVDQAPQNS